MALLALEHISRSFGAIQALSGVDLEVEPGEVVGLMGDNGAGKSTLAKIIAGNFPPSDGKMSFNGEEVAFTRPIDARAAGIEVVYQDLALADNLSAAANVFLGREVCRRVGPLRLLDHRRMAQRATALFAELKSETRAGDLVRQMSGGQRQAVAIARTRLADARLVIMDEPTAAISVRQVAEVLALIGRMRDAGGRRHPDQPPHAGRVRDLRPRRGDAPRPQGRRQAGGAVQPAGGHRSHHRRVGGRLTWTR